MMHSALDSLRLSIGLARLRMAIWKWHHSNSQSASSDPLVKAYSPNQPRGKDGRWVPVGVRLAAAAEKAGKNETIHVEIGRVRRPADLAAIVGKNVQGFKHAISNQTIAHIFKNHSNAKIEAARGHLPVLLSDIEELPAIIEAGSYSSAGPHKSFLQRFVVKAEIDGIGYHIISEVRPGKRRTDIVTMRKKKGAW